MISFKEYLVENNNEAFENIQTFMEMAEQHAVVRLPVLIDANDIKFLKQFDPRFWGNALHQRYDKFLRNALKVRCEQRLALEKALFDEFEKIALDYQSKLKNKQNPTLDFSSIQSIGQKFNLNISSDFIKDLENENREVFTSWIKQDLSDVSKEKAQDNLEKFASLETHNVIKNYMPFPTESETFKPNQKDEYIFGKDSSEEKESESENAAEPSKTFLAYSYIIPLIAKLEHDRYKEHFPESGLSGEGMYGYDLSTPYFRNKNTCVAEDGEFKFWGFELPTLATFKRTVKKFLSDNFHENYGVIHDFHNYKKSKFHFDENNEPVAPDLISLAKYHKKALLEDRYGQQTTIQFINKKSKINEDAKQKLIERYGEDEYNKAILILKNIIKDGYASYKQALPNEQLSYPDIITLAKYYKSKLSSPSEYKNLEKVINFINSKEPQDIQDKQRLINRYGNQLFEQSANDLNELYKSLKDPFKVKDSGDSQKAVTKTKDSLKPKVLPDELPPTYKTIYGIDNKKIVDEFFIESEKNRLESRFSKLLKDATISQEPKLYKQNFVNRQGRRDTYEITIFPIDTWEENINQQSKDNLKNTYIEKYSKQYLSNDNKLDKYLIDYNTNPDSARKYLVRVGREFFRSEAAKLANTYINELIQRNAMPLPHSTTKNHALHTNTDERKLVLPSIEKGKPKGNSIVLPHEVSEITEKDKNGNIITTKIPTPKVLPASFIRSLRDDELDDEGNPRKDLELDLVGFHKDKVRIPHDEYQAISTQAGVEGKQGLNFNSNTMPINSHPSNTPRYRKSFLKLNKRSDFQLKPIFKISGNFSISNFKNELKKTGQSELSEWWVYPIIFYAISDVYNSRETGQDEKDKILQCFDSIHDYVYEQITDNLNDPIINYDEQSLINAPSFEQFIEENSDKYSSEEDYTKAKKAYESYLEKEFPDDFEIYQQNLAKRQKFKNKISSKIKSVIQRESIEDCQSDGTRRRSKRKIQFSKQAAKTDQGSPLDVSEDELQNRIQNQMDQKEKEYKKYKGIKSYRQSILDSMRKKSAEIEKSQIGSKKVAAPSSTVINKALLNVKKLEVNVENKILNIIRNPVSYDDQETKSLFSRRDDATEYLRDEIIQNLISSTFDEIYETLTVDEDKKEFLNYFDDEINFQKIVDSIKAKLYTSLKI